MIHNIGTLSIVVWLYFFHLLTHITIFACCSYCTAMLLNMLQYYFQVFICKDLEFLSLFCYGLLDSLHITVFSVISIKIAIIYTRLRIHKRYAHPSEHKHRSYKHTFTYIHPYSNDCGIKYISAIGVSSTVMIV